jgi:putative FmdB family regulatory protein
MPVYAFRCQECGLEFEELVLRMGQTAPCPKCGQEKVERVLSVPAAHRGGGRGENAPSCGGAPDCGFS